MKLLQPIQVEDWRKGRIPYLERVIEGSLKSKESLRKVRQDLEIEFAKVLKLRKN